MDESTENELAKRMQKTFPLVKRPYQELAEAIGSTEDAVLERVALWKNEGQLREISAVLEGAILGYDSALVCGRIPVDRLNEIAAIVSDHPTVTHNYERRHEWNLWFTIAVPQNMHLEDHLSALSRLTGVEDFHALRRTETFKIGVVFDLKKRSNDTRRTAIPKSFKKLQIDAHFAHLTRTLQMNLPVCERPFLKLAHSQGLGERDLLDFARENHGSAVRRYVATFRHRRLGVKANGMTVWNVDDENLSTTGSLLAEAPEVSHCYGRTTFPGFPFNLYSMLHAPDTKTLERTAARLATEIKCDDYLILESPTEFKKERLRYFLPELDQWHQKYVQPAGLHR